MTEIKILCPRCPLCSGRPAKGLPLSISQAWCDNDDCATLCWDPSMSLDDNLFNAHAHRLGDWLAGGS
jgi:hypothetical protein